MLTKSSYFLFLAATMWGGTAGASVVFDQPPGANSNAEYISSTLDNFGAQPGYRVADNFSLAAGATISDVHWWGESNSGGDDFTFTFFSDNTGIPGSVLLSTSGTLTKSTVNVGSAWDPVTFYSSDLAVPFAGAAGTTYWLSIFNGASNASWLWLKADAPGDGAWVQQNGNQTWSALNDMAINDMAFQLTVPEPATLALLGLGLAGLGFTRSRKA